MTVLIVGAGGTIGSALLAACQSRQMDVIGTSSRGLPGTLPLDLGGVPLDWQIPSSVRLAVLAGAVTSINRCQREEEATRRINVDGTLALSRELALRGVYQVFLSSNLVFSGEQPQSAADLPAAPRTVYGEQKVAVETALLAMKQTCVLRLSKVLSPNDPLLCGWIHNLEEGRPIHPYHDMVMSPVSLEMVIATLMLILDRQPSGVLQLSATDDITYPQAAGYLAHRFLRDDGLIRPGSWTESSSITVRPPKHTTLDTSAWGRLTGWKTPHPQQALEMLAAATGNDREHWVSLPANSIAT